MKPHSIFPQSNFWVSLGTTTESAESLKWVARYIVQDFFGNRRRNVGLVDLAVGTVANIAFTFVLRAFCVLEFAECESVVTKRLKCRPPLWSRGNIVASHAAGPGSIPGRVNLLVKDFSGGFLNRKTNVKKFGPHSSSVIIWLRISSRPYLHIIRR